MSSIPPSKWRELHENPETCDVVLVVGPKQENDEDLLTLTTGLKANAKEGEEKVKHEEKEPKEKSTEEDAEKEEEKKKEEEEEKKDDSPIKEYFAHRLVLAAASPVFEKMIGDDITTPRDANNRLRLRVWLEEQHSAVFSTLLNFIYNNTSGATDRNVLPLLKTARHFELASLASMCLQYLQKSLGIEAIISLFRQLPPGEERDVVMRLLREKASYVLSSSSLGDLNEENMLAIISDSGIEVAEVEVFTAVVRWGEKQLEKQDLPATTEHLRNVVKPLVKHIRFPILSFKDFILKVVPSGILEESDLLSVFDYLAKKPLNLVVSNKRPKPVVAEPCPWLECIELPPLTSIEPANMPFNCEPRDALLGLTDEWTPEQDYELAGTNIFD